MGADKQKAGLDAGQMWLEREHNPRQSRSLREGVETALSWGWRGCGMQGPHQQALLLGGILYRFGLGSGVLGSWGWPHPGWGVR